MKTIEYTGSNGKEYIWKIWTSGPEVFTEYGTKDGLKQVSSFTCEPKNIGKSNETTAEEQAVVEAEALYKHKLERKSAIVQPMLAKNCNDYNIEFPVYVQAKLDGTRCIAVHYNEDWHLVSRSGHELHVPHILEYVKKWGNPYIAYDGELYIHGESFQRINQLVSKNIPESSRLEYHIFDCINYSNLMDPFWSRMCKIKNKIIPTHEVSSYEELAVLKTKLESEGYEGVIVRNMEGVYKFGRSKDLLKLKSFDDDEFEILGYKIGKGKFKDCPVWVCKVGNLTFEATQIGSFIKRKEILNNAESYIGKMMKVKYFGLTRDGIPRFPIALGVREDFDR